MTCSVFNCCDNHRKNVDGNSTTRPARAQKLLKRDGLVLLLAPSDVLHVLRSSKIRVILLDARDHEHFCAAHIKDSINYPYDLLNPLSSRDIVGDSSLTRFMSEVTAGSLSDLMKIEKGSAASNATEILGTCVIIYDDMGDIKDLPGPAALLAQLLVDSGVVKEVGRLAGGFHAFKELNSCIEYGQGPPSRASSASGLHALSVGSISSELLDPATRQR